MKERGRGLGIQISPIHLPMLLLKIILLNSFSEAINKNSRAAIFWKSLKFPEIVYLLLSALNCQKLKALQDILIQTYKFYLTIFENE